NLAGTYVATVHHTLGWFAEVSYEDFSPYNALAQPPSRPDQPDQTRLHAALALQDQAAFIDQRLLLVPTVRYEHLEDATSATFTLSNEPTGAGQIHQRNLWSPSIGAEVRPWEWVAV